MSDKKTIVKISDEEIKKGIKQGRFKESGTQIRDISNGQIVKVFKDHESGFNNIPSTFIQVHNNYVYQANLSPVIEAIAHNRENQVYELLEEQYNLAMDYLDSYSTYETGIEKVHQICLEMSVSFDNKIRREIETLEIKNIEEMNTERFLGSLNAYVKVLFSYIVSTYVLHREKFAKDKVIISKILSLENSVRGLYEQLLAESSKQKNNDGKSTTIIPMKTSLYSMYLFHDDYDLNELDRLVQHDSRFSTSLQLVSFFKEHFKSGHIPSFGNHYDEGEVKISISTRKIASNSNRNKMANTLFLILEDINKLKEIRGEIVSLKDVTNKDVLNTFS